MRILRSPGCTNSVAFPKMFRASFCKLCSQTRHSRSPHVKHKLLLNARHSMIAVGSYRPPLQLTKNAAIRLECNTKYFSVSSVHRFPLPPIAALIIRPVAKFFAMLLGIRIRRWWTKLSEKEKQKFWYNVRERRKQIAVTVTGLIGLFFMYCAVNSEVDPITGKRRFIVFTQQQMVELANSISNELLNENRQAVLSPSHPYYKVAHSVAMRIIDSNKSYDRVKDRKWYLVVVKDPRVNAMVLPNGMIIVFSGLLDVANKDQIAVVLSHEIAHCLLNHHAIRLSLEHIIEILWLIPLTLMWAVFPIPEAILGYVLGHYFKSVTMLLPYERDQETEADKYGLLLAANACVDVRQAPVFWKKMEQIDPSNKDTIWWLASHPPHSERVKYIQDLLPYSLEVRQQNGCPPLDSSYWSRFSLF